MPYWNTLCARISLSMIIPSYIKVFGQHNSLLASMKNSHFGAWRRLSPAKKPTIVLVAGGSGGHVFPAIALAEHNQSQLVKKNIYLLTDERGVSFTKGYDHLFSEIHVAGQKLGYILPTWKWLRSVKPSTILGFGGALTILPILMGRLLRLNCGFHQSDLVLGRANQFLRPFVHGAFFAYKCKNNQDPNYAIGTPVRKEFHTIALHNTIDPSFLSILILGGSQGSRVWTSLFPAAVALLPDTVQEQLLIVHQVRPEDRTAVVENYKKTKASVTFAPFFSDMAHQMDKAHIVFTRAGAGAIAELAAAGRPAFFIPYPYAQGHQGVNAEFVVQKKAGWMSKESDVTKEEIATFLRDCLHNPHQLIYAGKQMKTLSNLNACDRLFTFCT